MKLVKEIEQTEKEMKNYQLNQLNKQLKKLKEKQQILIFEITLLNINNIIFNLKFNILNVI